MTTPSGWVDPNPPDTSDARAKTTLTIAAVALTAVVIAALVAVVVTHRSGLFDDRTDAPVVVMIAADNPAPQPFMPSVVLSPTLPSDRAASEITALTATLPTSADLGVRVASGTQPGLYGGTVDSASCDVPAAANQLDAHPDRAAAWSQAIGLRSTAQIPYYLNTLTAVTLTVDTWVTAHSYADGRVRPFQAVLQAGSAVLVDAVGVPRMECATGNPLIPHADRGFAHFTEDHDQPWPGYQRQDVVAISYESQSAATEFVLIDLASSEPLPRPVGGMIDLAGIPTELGQLPGPGEMNHAPVGDVLGPDVPR